jgi:hypothetical protein
VVRKQLVIHLSTLIHNEERRRSAVLFGWRTVLPYSRDGRMTACASLLALIAVSPVPGRDKDFSRPSMPLALANLC